MKFLVSALLALFALSTNAQTASTQYQHINWAWQQSSTAPVCSSTVTSKCGISYQLNWTDPTGAVGSPVTIIWPATSYAYGPGGFLYCGTWQGNLILTYKDESGSLQTTVPIGGTAVVACPFVLSPPSGLKGTPAA